MVSIPAENSFQPTHSMKHAVQDLKAMRSTHVYPHTRMCSATTHIIVLATASPLRTESPIMWYLFIGTCKMCTRSSTKSTSLDRWCIRSCSHSSHLTRRRGKKWSTHYHSSEWHSYYYTPYEQRNRNMMHKPPSQYLNKPPKGPYLGIKEMTIGILR